MSCYTKFTSIKKSTYPIVRTVRIWSTGYGGLCAKLTGHLVQGMAWSECYPHLTKKGVLTLL